jgi:predicted nucleic acid-binding protein
MNDRVFVDTNILVYAHDLDAGVKNSTAPYRFRTKSVFPKNLKHKT